VDEASDVFVFGHSFARYITSYIAYINIHLDIHRIIIISYHTDTDSCFGSKNAASKAESCFIVYEKKGRCFSPSAQKAQSFVHIEAFHTLMER
jgi:hypothetical protein